MFYSPMLALYALAGVSGVSPADSGPRYAVKMEFNSRVRMRDGVELSADVYRPDAPGKFPVILVRTPYDNGTAPNVRAGKWWASRGFAYVIQDVRGRGDSDGTFYPLVTEAEDGDATITWYATQPWSSGKVGMTGSSYLGWVQGYAVGMKNPALAALVMVVTPPDPHRNFPVQFGAYNLTTISWLASISGHTLQNLSELDLGAAFHYLPFREADTKLGRTIPAWRDWIDHPTLDEYWKKQQFQEKMLDAKVPILHVSGWYDDVLIGTLENYLNLSTRAADSATRARQWLLLGPWPHSINAAARLGDIDFGPQSLIDFDGLQLRWFDHWLNGADNGVERDPRVRLFLMGENAWRDEREWPLARAQSTRYYLHSGGRANSLAGDGTLSTVPPAEEPADRFRYDPAHPVPFLGAENYSQVGGPDDYRSVERRDDVLVYTTPPFDAEFQLCGPITAKVYAASSGKDTDWTTKIVDVHPTGYAQRLNDGIVRGRFRNGLEREVFLTPGKVEEYTIDNWATCTVLLRGHRLRVEVSSSAVPKFDPNLNTGGPIGREAQGVVADQVVYHDRQRPSYVVLPVVPKAN